MVDARDYRGGNLCTSIVVCCFIGIICIGATAITIVAWRSNTYVFPKGWTKINLLVLLV